MSEEYSNRTRFRKAVSQTRVEYRATPCWSGQDFCTKPLDSVLDLSFTGCRGAREPGPVPPNRRAPTLREKTSQLDSSGSPFLGLAVPQLKRLALRAGDCSAR